MKKSKDELLHGIVSGEYRRSPEPRNSMAACFWELKLFFPYKCPHCGRKLKDEGEVSASDVSWHHFYSCPACTYKYYETFSMEAW